MEHSRRSRPRRHRRGHRFGVGAEVGREHVQAQVGHVLPHEAAREPDRVDAPVPEAAVAVTAQRGIEESAVEADVVPRSPRHGGTRAASAATLRSPARRHHRFGDAGEQRDERWQRHARVHERVEPAEQLSTRSLSAPISVMRSLAGEPPVVSRSMTTNVTSESGVARSGGRLPPGQSKRTRVAAYKCSQMGPARTIGAWATSTAVRRAATSPASTWCVRADPRVPPLLDRW